MASNLTEGLAAAPEAIGKAVTKVNDCSSGLRRAVEATFIAGAEDTHHLLEGVGHGAQDGVGKSAEAVEKAAKEAKHQVELVMPAIILVVWTASAVALTYHTKWTLSSSGAAFTFPVFYTFVTTVVIFIGCSSIMLIQKKTNTVGLTQFREQWKGILAVAILSILAIWSSDCSMMFIGVTLNQLLKACTPFPTMLFGMCIERKTFAWPMMLAVLMIVVGAGLAVPMADATGSTYGLIMAGLSTLFAACKISVAARLMSDSANNGLTPLVLLFYSSLASVPVLLIWFLVIDERSEVPEYIAENPGLTFIILFLASIYAFLLNLLGNTLTKITSALTMTIAGAGRQIGIIVVTGVFIEHTFNDAINYIGLVIFVSAIISYAYMSFNSKLKAKSKPFHIGGEAKVISAANKFKKKSATEKTPLNP